MKYIQTHAMGSDCTAPYDIVNWQEDGIVTAADFVRYRLSRTNGDWGRINVVGHGIVNYKKNKLDREMPSEWEKLTVTKMDCAGGYSNMDYRIFVNGEVHKSIFDGKRIELPNGMITYVDEEKAKDDTDIFDEIKAKYGLK